MLSGLELIIGLVMVFLGSLVLGTIGFGLGMVAMPVLLLILAPQETVVIINAMIVLTAWVDVGTNLATPQTEGNLAVRGCRGCLPSPLPSCCWTLPTQWFCAW